MRVYYTLCIVLAFMILVTACGESESASKSTIPPSQTPAAIAVGNVATSTQPGWFSKHKDLIAGLSGMTIMLALFTTAIALFITAREVSRNIRMNKAKAMYEIQRDARESSRLLREDEVVAKEIFGAELNDEARVRAAVRQIINFYGSVFQLRGAPLDEQMWIPFEKELYVFFQLPMAQQHWQEVKELCDPDYVVLIDRIIIILNSNNNINDNIIVWREDNDRNYKYYRTRNRS